MAPRKVPGKFPLWLHKSGQWAKRINGRCYYFGTDADAALKKYAAERDAIETGREPRPDADSLTVKGLVNAFLNEKRGRVDVGELSPRTWAEYLATGKTLTAKFGPGRMVADLRPDDFAGLRAAAAKRYGPVSLTNYITRVRVFFKYAVDFDLLDRPVRYGAGFDRPPKKAMRAARTAKGKRLVAAADLWKMLDQAGSQLKAMMLLALNGGLGSSDCAALAETNLSSRPGWVEYPRPKTGADRRFPLWPETAQAIKDAAKTRPAPRAPAHAGLVFLTRTRVPWVRFDDTGGKRTVIDSVALMYGKLRTAAGVAHVGSFYALRHVFRTIADEVPDRPAIDLIMGHVDQTMADPYRERIADERLTRVTGHVRAWLLAGKAES